MNRLNKVEKTLAVYRKEYLINMEKLIIEFQKKGCEILLCHDVNEDF